MLQGIPVKYFPEDEAKMPAVQMSALIADLVLKTKQQLTQLPVDKDSGQGSGGFQYIRMRTQQDTEMIVTDYITSSGYEYILVTLQNCKFTEEEEVEGDEEKKE